MFAKNSAYLEEIQELDKAYGEIFVQDKAHRRKQKDMLLKLEENIESLLFSADVIQPVLLFLAKYRFPASEKMNNIKEKLLELFEKEEIDKELVRQALRKQGGLTTKKHRELFAEKKQQAPVVFSTLDSLLKSSVTKKKAEALPQQTKASQALWQRWALIAAVSLDLMLASSLVLLLSSSFKKNSPPSLQKEQVVERLKNHEYKSQYIINKQQLMLHKQWFSAPIKKTDIYFAGNAILIPTIWGNTFADIYQKANISIEEYWGMEQAFVSAEDMASFMGIDVSQSESKWLYHKGLLIIYRADLVQRKKNLLPSVQTAPLFVP